MAEMTFTDIVKFIKQASTNALTTRQYPKKYMELDAKVSFGQGTPARVPWIAFLDFGQLVQEGIYPALLYYKAEKTLFLTYCVSATNPPKFKWVFSGQTPQTVAEHYAENGMGNPPKFKESFVYRSYAIRQDESDAGLDENLIMSDLAAIVEQFKSQFAEIKEPSMEGDHFFNAITKFIAQAQEQSLSSLGYPKEFHDLEVKVGFGESRPFTVPWMAFLGFGQLVNKGIYPALLYYKNHKMLILSYLISKENRPDKEWDFGEAKPRTIRSYFQNSGVEEEQNYDSNYMRSAYPIDINKANYGLDNDIIIKDLSGIITEYGNQFDDVPELHWVDSFLKDAKSAQFMIDNDMALRFTASLLTKPFVILTGLSGSGKTKLAQIFAKWICDSEDQYRLVPVGADWTNREPLLGYPNALDPNEYVKPDTGVLDLIIEAAKPQNLEKPYFLILDEMNMSHVERYFADFLSSMESKEEIFLHPNSKAISGVPSAITISNNLFIIGTVNIDETTYMFSPKVLDRASVIEFRVSSQDMNKYLQGQNSSGIDMEIGLGKVFSGIFMEMAAAQYKPQDFTRKSLMMFFEELEKIGAEFGYRTAFEINRFCGIVRDIGLYIEEERILDFAIMQKLLPKVHGSRRKLEPVLRKMIELCLADLTLFDDLIQKKKEVESNDPAIRYPLSLRKILRMYWGMTDNGFTSYTEA